MWQGVGSCGRQWGHVTRARGKGRDGDMWQGWGHVAGGGCMWQGLGACGRVWAYVAGDGGHVTRAMSIWQGEGWGHVVEAMDMWQRLWTCGRVGACGRGWICENMSNGRDGVCGRVWGQVVG